MHLLGSPSGRVLNLVTPNGFLTAALLSFGLVLLDRRPIAAGILFGLLAYKPQFGLMIPLVLIASGRGTAFRAAAVTVAALVLVSTMAFGPKVWSAFFESLHFTRVVVLEAETPAAKFKRVSWARMWGLDPPRLAVRGGDEALAELVMARRSEHVALAGRRFAHRDVANAYSLD